MWSSGMEYGLYDALGGLTTATETSSSHFRYSPSGAAIANSAGGDYDCIEIDHGAKLARRVYGIDRESSLSQRRIRSDFDL